MIYKDLTLFFFFAILIYEYMHNFYCRCFLYFSELHITFVASQLVSRPQMESMKWQTNAWLIKKKKKKGVSAAIRST